MTSQLTIPGAGLKVEKGEGWAGVGNVLQQVWRHNCLCTWCRAEGWERWRLGWSWKCSGQSMTSQLTIPGAGLKVEEGEGWAGVGNVLQQVGQLSVRVQLSNKVLPVAVPDWTFYIRTTLRSAIGRAWAAHFLNFNYIISQGALQNWLNFEIGLREIPFQRVLVWSSTNNFFFFFAAWYKNLSYSLILRWTADMEIFLPIDWHTFIWWESAAKAVL